MALSEESLSYAARVFGAVLGLWLAFKTDEWIQRRPRAGRSLKPDCPLCEAEYRRRQGQEAHPDE